ncbi:alpha/beta hydrolase [Pseudomonas sp. OTU5201]|uniref:alpha/beta hydrolase n=1 Tax=Pseudomonas sp. OTU5201 TaxID=3043850 RepID=UPI00313D9905
MNISMKGFVPLIILFQLLVSGCESFQGDTSPPPEPMSPPDSAKALVRVMFATNRNLIQERFTCAGMFGAERATLSYGYCDVSIPPDHRIGVIESPSWLSFEFREDEEKHITLRDGRAFTKQQFDDYLYSYLQEDGATFIYVHGYNVGFEDAAKRTAQMAYDLKFKGVPAFFSWPSKDAFEAYPADEATVEWAELGLYRFLVDYLKRPDVKKMYLIAHSMGNRAVTTSIVRLYEQHPDLKSKLREIVLAAPDIDTGVFTDKIAPAIAAGQRPVTLYASSKDRALIASKEFHDYSRIGDSTEVLVLPGIETIDASLIKTGFLGHSYYGDSDSLIADMYVLFGDGKRASDRFRLKKYSTDAGDYWKFLP